MKRDEWMLLSLTFLTGLAIGMYVYIVAFKPTYAPENLSGVESEANEWSMVGKRRAEFHNSDYVYPSFRLWVTVVTFTCRVPRVTKRSNPWRERFLPLPCARSENMTS
jgi:hypothetical protein